MITVKELFKDVKTIDEDALVEISDKLWTIGSLEQIKNAATPDVFLLYIGLNMIGNWKGEGWHGVICNQPELVPHIPETLEALGLKKIRLAFDKVIDLFPQFTIFSDNDKSFSDIINFLIDEDLKVSDERLKSIPIEERKKLCEEYHDNLDVLENITEALWGSEAENDGWKEVLNYIDTHK